MPLLDGRCRWIQSKGIESRSIHSGKAENWVEVVIKNLYVIIQILSIFTELSIIATFGMEINLVFRFFIEFLWSSNWNREITVESILCYVLHTKFKNKDWHWKTGSACKEHQREDKILVPGDKPQWYFPSARAHLAILPLQDNDRVNVNSSIDRLFRAPPKVCSVPWGFSARE